MTADSPVRWMPIVGANTAPAVTADKDVTALPEGDACPRWQSCLNAGNEACWRRQHSEALDCYLSALDNAYSEFEENRQLDAGLAVSSVIVSLLNLAGAARDIKQDRLALKCFACGFGFLLDLRRKELADKQLMAEVNSFFMLISQEWTAWQTGSC